MKNFCARTKGEKRHSKMVVICKPRGETLEEIKPADTLILEFQAAKWQEVDFCCLSCPVCSILLWCFSKLIQREITFFVLIWPNYSSQHFYLMKQSSLLVTVQHPFTLIEGQLNSVWKEEISNPHVNNTSLLQLSRCHPNAESPTKIL